jgi:hypothetical protein
VWRAIGGILEWKMRKSRCRVCCRGQTGANRVAGTFNACYVAIGQMRECASAVFGVTLCRPSPSVLDLTCSVYHIPPHRACPGAQSPATCGNAACAAAISSIDDATLSLMKTGFTVSPGPRRVLVLARIQARVHGRAAGRAKEGMEDLTRLGPPLQACGMLPDSDPRKNFTVHATYLGYDLMHSVSTSCGLPASTVKLTPPALNTCDGAFSRLMVFYRM